MTCAHFRFVTSTYSALNAPNTLDDLAAAATTARQMFPGVFDVSAQPGPRTSPVTSPVASPVSSPSMPPLVAMDEDIAPTHALGYDIASVFHRGSRAVSISSINSDETEDDQYTVGNGLRYLHDPITATPKVAIADPDFELATRGITRFYVVTVGTDVGIFKTL